MKMNNMITSNNICNFGNFWKCCARFRIFSANYLNTFFCIWELPRNSYRISLKSYVKMANFAGKKFWKTRNCEKLIFILKNFGRLFCWNVEVGAVQKLESNVGKSLETTHTTKKCENVKRISRNSKKQMMNYLVPQRKGTAVKRPKE